MAPKNVGTSRIETEKHGRRGQQDCSCWQMKALAAKAEDLSSIPRTHMLEGEDQLQKVVLTSTRASWHAHMGTQICPLTSTCVHTHTNKMCK